MNSDFMMKVIEDLSKDFGDSYKKGIIAGIQLTALVVPKDVKQATDEAEIDVLKEKIRKVVVNTLCNIADISCDECPYNDKAKGECKLTDDITKDVTLSLINELGLEIRNERA